MSLPPTIVPAKPRVRRKRERTPSAPAPAPIAITGAWCGGSASVVRVVFAEPITWDGVNLPAEFRAWTVDGDLESPMSVYAVGPNWVELNFNADVEPGAQWVLDGAMAGITPAVAFPQAGAVQE